MLRLGFVFSALLPGLIAVCSIGDCLGQSITVLDHSNGKPIESATVLSNKPKAFVITSPLGQADIKGFVGAEKIEIRSLGYQSQFLSYAQISRLNFVVRLEHSNFEIDAVVISATRWGQLAWNIPNKISGINSKEVAFQNPQTAADLLGISGEVFIQKSQQGGGSPMIRGFSANRLLYTVDGVRMNTAIFRSGNIQNVISLDPFAIENTEVLFGPSSILYGSDAIGGVMSFQTLVPKFTKSDTALFFGKAVSRFSSANNELTGHVDFGVGWKKWAMLSSITYSDFGDLKMGKHGPDDYLRPFYVERIHGVDRVVHNSDPRIQTPTGYNQINLMQKILYQPNNKWDIQYGFHYSSTSEFGRYDRLIETMPDGMPRSAVWNYGPQKWMMNALSFSHDNPTVIFDKLSIRLAMQFFEESRIDRNFAGSQRFRLRTNQEQVKAYSGNFDFQKNLGRHQFYYGAEQVLNQVYSIGSAVDIRTDSAIDVPDRYPNSNWLSTGIYLNYQYTFSNRLLFLSGVRYNVFKLESDFSRHLQFYPLGFTTNEINHNATTASIGLVFRPASTWKISFNASTGFRAPNVDDIGKIFDFAAGEVVVPNPRLKSEYAYNGEVNLSKIMSDAVKFDVSGFYTYLDKAMVRRAYQVNGADSIDYGGDLSRVFAIQNAAFAYVYGYNVGIEIKLPAGFRFYSRYNFQRGMEEMESGETSRSRHAAPAFGVARLSYSRSKFMIQAYVVFSAKVDYAFLNEEERQKPALYAKDPNGNPFAPGWYTLNLKAQYALNEAFALNGGLENISNQRYRPYSSGLAAAGINLVLSVRAHF